jgi:tetratricopeptide (TPR) repeat protein
VATKDEAIAHGYRLLQRKPVLALQQASEILRQYPNDPSAYRLQALARRQGGDEAGAREAERSAIASATFDRDLMQAGVALVSNDLPLAERTLKQRLRNDPYDFTAIRLLAEVASRIGRFDDSERLLRRAIEIAPSFAEAKANLASVLHRQGRAPETLALLDELDAAGELSDANLNLRAAALGRVGRYREAIELYRSSLKRKPKESKVWMSLGHLLKTVGEQDESVAAYRRAIELQPTLGEVWWSLANLKTVRFDEAQAEAMSKALDAPDLDDDDRLHLHFALGKYHEDRKEADRSWHHYQAGNRIRSGQIGYSAASEKRLVDRTVKLMTSAFFKSREGQGDPSPDPIFIVGMPRAGSTLIEQILASHSQVEGTMELPDIAAIARSIGNRHSADKADNYPLNIAKLDAEALRGHGADYIARTRIHRIEGRPFFIDKMPNNWQHVGLIRLILPNARIIDARRSPLDCGFSNFKQHFARGQNFSYGLGNIGRYYADYVRMMSHFDKVQPGRIHRVIHERLVDDPEAEVRALLAYCGLDFEESCLKFHENKRAVRTASSEQVRQPLSKSGFDRWRMYEEWLGPLKKALGPALDHWDDAPRP